MFYFIHQDTKLDVLNILANVSASKNAVSEVRVALQGISEWFDEYMAEEETKPGQVWSRLIFILHSVVYSQYYYSTAQEPELHKAMVLLLARCWDYKLKTEDVLELTQARLKSSIF